MKINKDELPNRIDTTSLEWWNKFWELSESNFGGPNMKLTDIVSNFIENLKKPMNTINTVDIGSGNGRYAIPFAELGLNTTAVEFTKNGSERIKKSAEEKKLHIEVINDDFLKVQPIEQDIVFASGFIEELGSTEKQLQALELMKQWTKKGGLLVCRYCIEISERGILVDPEDLIIQEFLNPEWEIVLSDLEPKLRDSLANISFENKLRAATLVAIKK